jgi:hypothetical protein
LHNAQCTMHNVQCTLHNAHCTLLYCTVHTVQYTVQYTSQTQCTHSSIAAGSSDQTGSQLASHLVSLLVLGDLTSPGLPYRFQRTAGSTRPVSLVPCPFAHIPDGPWSRSPDPKSQLWDWGPRLGISYLPSSPRFARSTRPTRLMSPSPPGPPQVNVPSTLGPLMRAPPPPPGPPQVNVPSALVPSMRPPPPPGPP